MKLKKFAAAAAALIITAQVAAVGVSAEKVYLGGNGFWYSTLSAAQHVGGTGVSKDTSEMTQSEIDGVIRYDPGASSSAYSSYYNSYSEVTHRWYTSYNAALAASGNNKAAVSGGNVYTDTTYSSYYPYKSTVTGYYYHNYNDALAASGGNRASVLTSSEYSPYDYTTRYTTATNSGWYSTATGKWYSSYSAAVAASGGNTAMVYSGYAPSSTAYYGDYGYFSSYTGKWYNTYSEAVAASNGNSAYVTGGYINGSYYLNDPYSYYYNYYYYPYAYSYGYGYNGYYYNYDANYYAYMAWKNRTGNSSSSTKDTTTVSAGVPYIKNYKKYNGWDSIAKLAKEAKSGQSLIIMMNGAQVVPENVISAVKGRNVGLRFVLENGSYWTVNGTKISSAQQFDTYIEYNIDFIPKKLKDKAKKGSIAAYQVGLTSSFTSLGGKYTVTLPLPAERTGNRVKVYRYDRDNNKLIGVATNMVADGGNLTFSITDGGAYYIVAE